MSLDGTDEELERLVGATAGPQLGRRIFHAAWGCALAATIAYAPVGRTWLLGAFASGLVLMLAVDLFRLASPRANRLFFKAFRWFASPREKGRIASSTWYAVGALIVLALFESQTAISAILVLALADPAASYIGRRWGRRRLGTGTFLGVAVFAAVATAVLAFSHPPGAALSVGLVVALIECQPLGLDDNLTVPVSTAVALLAWATVFP